MTKQHAGPAPSFNPPRRRRRPRSLGPEQQADRLRRLRIAAGKLFKISQRPFSTTDMAKLIGVSQVQYSHYETRGDRPSNAALGALRDQFDVTADWVLLGDEDNMPHFLLEALNAVTEEDLMGITKKRG